MVSKFALAFTGLAGAAAHQSVKFRDQMAVTFGVVVLPAASDSAEIFAIDQGACRAISEKK